MHEMSIAIPLVEQLQALAAEHNAARVEALTVTAGVMRQVVPEALVVAFEIAAAETCAAGATLTVEILPLAARCRQCGRRFEPSIDSFVCDRCNQADVEIIDGNDVVLTSVTFQQADDEDQPG